MNPPPPGSQVLAELAAADRPVHVNDPAKVGIPYAHTGIDADGRVTKTCPVCALVVTSDDFDGEVDGAVGAERDPFKVAGAAYAQHFTEAARADLGSFHVEPA